MQRGIPQHRSLIEHSRQIYGQVPLTSSEDPQHDLLPPRLQDVDSRSQNLPIATTSSSPIESETSSQQLSCPSSLAPGAVPSQEASALASPGSTSSIPLCTAHKH